MFTAGHRCTICARSTSVPIQDETSITSFLSPGDIFFFSHNSYVVCVKRSSTPSILPKRGDGWKKKPFNKKKRTDSIGV